MSALFEWASAFDVFQYPFKSLLYCIDVCCRAVVEVDL